MNLADAVLLGIVVVAGLLGVLRGFVGIVVSTVAWLSAGWCAFQFGRPAALALSADGHPSALQWLGGYALTFIGVFLAVSVLGWLLRMMVRTADLSSLDRVLGLGVGVLSGALLSTVLVLLLGFTPMRDDPDWNRSLSVSLFNPAADWMRAQLPEWNNLLRPLDSSLLPGTGDNVRFPGTDSTPPAAPVPLDAPGD